MALAGAGALLSLVVAPESTVLASQDATAAVDGSRTVAPAPPVVWPPAIQEQDGSTGESVDAELLEKGRELYASQCLPCHGREGQGDGPAARFLDPKPRNLTDGDWLYAEGGTVEAIAGVIAAGIDDTSMEPFADLMTEEEIIAVATFVREVIAAPAATEGSSR